MLSASSREASSSAVSRSISAPAPATSALSAAACSRACAVSAWIASIAAAVAPPSSRSLRELGGGLLAGGDGLVELLGQVLLADLRALELRARELELGGELGQLLLARLRALELRAREPQLGGQLGRVACGRVTLLLGAPRVLGRLLRAAPRRPSRSAIAAASSAAMRLLALLRLLQLRRARPRLLAVARSSCCATSARCSASPVSCVLSSKISVRAVGELRGDRGGLALLAVERGGAGRGIAAEVGQALLEREPGRDRGGELLLAGRELRVRRLQPLLERGRPTACSSRAAARTSSSSLCRTPASRSARASSPASSSARLSATCRRPCASACSAVSDASCVGELAALGAQLRERGRGGREGGTCRLALGRALRDLAARAGRARPRARRDRCARGAAARRAPRTPWRPPRAPCPRGPCRRAGRGRRPSRPRARPGGRRARRAGAGAGLLELGGGAGLAPRRAPRRRLP